MRAGLVYGISACLIWGLFPLYFSLLEPAGPMEVLAHRIVWSLLAVLAVVLGASRLWALRATVLDARKLKLLSVAAVLIAVNWGMYIYAVSVDHVLEAALGYFINPLVSVAFGLLLFRERLRRAQIAALGLGTLAVVVLTAYYGGFPWIALGLAASFGTYGALKKLADVEAAESLAVETLVLCVPALAFLLALGSAGDPTFGDEGLAHALLLVATGPVTAVPLLLFGASVRRLPLSTLGLLQYIMPVMQFLIGWLLMDEAMPLSRWIGFALVWSALAILTVDLLRTAGTRRRTRLASGTLEVT